MKAYVLFAGALILAGCATPEPRPAAPPPPAESAAFEPVASIHQDVVQALDRAPNLDVSGIDVTVRGTDVYLEGSVPSESQRLAAHEVAHSVAGVERVFNSLRVGQ